MSRAIIFLNASCDLWMTWIFTQHQHPVFLGNLNIPSRILEVSDLSEFAEEHPPDIIPYCMY